MFKQDSQNEKSRSPKSNPAEATARPWRNNTADETAIIGRDGDDVASTFFGDEDYDKNYATRAADAALTVKCVNSHDALVRALEEIASKLRENALSFDDNASGEEIEYALGRQDGANYAAKIARAALAGAK